MHSQILICHVYIQKIAVRFYQNLKILLIILMFCSKIRRTYSKFYLYLVPFNKVNIKRCKPKAACIFMVFFYYHLLVIEYLMSNMLSCLKVETVITFSVAVLV